MKYFHNVFTLEELKKAYRKLALIHHPDRGGNEKDFIALKNEYDQLFKQLNRKGNTQSTPGAEKQEYTYTYEEVNNFKEIIDELINFDIELEIIGSWVWVSGDTKPIKDKLKELNFKWASKKMAWYYHEGEYKKFHKKNFTMDEIRNMHQSKKFKTNKRAALK